MKIRNETDFWSGAMFIAFGLFFGAFATRYDFGTAKVMGPAYFPTVLGGLLALVGVLMALAGLGRAGEGGKLEKFHFAGLAWVLGSVVIYAAIPVSYTHLDVYKRQLFPDTWTDSRSVTPTCRSR